MCRLPVPVGGGGAYPCPSPAVIFQLTRGRQQHLLCTFLYRQKVVQLFHTNMFLGTNVDESNVGHCGNTTFEQQHGKLLRCLHFEGLNTQTFALFDHQLLQTAGLSAAATQLVSDRHV